MFSDHPILVQTNQDRALHNCGKIAHAPLNCSNIEFKKKNCWKKYRHASKRSRSYLRKKRISNRPIKLWRYKSPVYLTPRSNKTDPKLIQRVITRPRTIFKSLKMREPMQHPVLRKCQTNRTCKVRD